MISAAKRAIATSTFGVAWRNRPAHERWLLAAPLVALAIVGLYIGVIEPLQAASRALQAELPALEARRDAVRLQTQEARAAKAPAQRGRIDTATIRTALERQRLLDSSAVVEAAADDRARLALSRAPFFSVWPLLQALQTDSGFRVVSLRIDRIDASHVRVDALLAAPGP